MKSAAGVTASEREVVFVRLPDVPVTVTVKVPVVAAAFAESVSTLLVFEGLGANEAVTPLGKPEAEKVTLPLKPFCGTTVIVLEPLVPCTMLRLLGEADSVKDGVCTAPGQLFTKFAALSVPMPVAKSQPTLVPYAGANDVSEVESTPTEPSAR